MDRVERMRAFNAVVATGSFTAAAERLGVGTAQISKGVKALEADLGVRLLNRTTRMVRPTETGAAFHTRALRLVEDFDELCASVRDEHATPRGVLKATAPVNFGELTLEPIVSDFLAAYPETRVELHLTDRHVGLIDEGFDLAIRIGELESSSLIARRLADAAVVCCASPGYLAAAGTPKRPEDLAAHPCVIDANLRGGEAWPFKVDGKRVTVRVDGRLRVNSAVAVRRQALRGAGVALCPEFAVREDLARGDLVALLEPFNAFEMGVYAVYLESRHLSAKMRAFMDHVARALKAGRGATAG